jgi:hypothetical protein
VTFRDAGAPESHAAAPPPAAGARVNPTQKKDDRPLSLETTKRRLLQLTGVGRCVENDGDWFRCWHRACLPQPVCVCQGCWEAFCGTGRGSATAGFGQAIGPYRTLIATFSDLLPAKRQKQFYCRPRPAAQLLTISPGMCYPQAHAHLHPAASSPTTPEPVLDLCARRRRRRRRGRCAHPRQRRPRGRGPR